MRRLETVSVVEALEEELVRRVLDGELAPGEHLRETELSEQYEVGRHTLRAAFDGLVHRGVLQRARNRGVFVREFTERDLAEIYELRTALEAQAFRSLAARRAVPDAARDAIARLRALDAGSPRRLVVDADLAFHRAVVIGVGNGRLARAHEDLQVEIRLCLAQLVQGYATARELAAQHDDLLRAIESGRPARAEAAIRGHLEEATRWLIERAATRSRHAGRSPAAAAAEPDGASPSGRSRTSG
jgi:DNA-binding GntR family transcriptional regulator